MPVRKSKILSHNDLVRAACRWLRNHEKCGVVLCESMHASESPDAIGWRGAQSIVIECKTSRADFRSDSKKSWRRYSTGMGVRRFFLMPLALAREMLPEVTQQYPQSGLLGLRGRGVTVLRKAECRALDQIEFESERNLLERTVVRLLSGRRYLAEEGRFEPWEDFQARVAAEEDVPSIDNQPPVC